MIQIKNKARIPVLMTLAESTFFIYGVHAMVILLFLKLVQKFVPQSDLLMTITYVFVPIACAAMCAHTFSCWQDY